MSLGTKLRRVAALIALLGLPVGAYSHEGDFFIGHNGAGQLTIEFDFSQTLPLDFVDGLLHGCALDEPGYASLDVDEPDEDFFTLGASASIVLEVTAVDSGFKAYTPGFAQTLDAAGEQWIIGAPAFDTHLLWHIDSNEPGFNPGSTYSLSFKIMDTGSTGYSESEVYTVTFHCAARGACCIDGACESEFEIPCGHEGGTYFGDGTVCLESGDGDTIDDLCDNCPTIANQDQVNSDGDAAGDACDGCPDDPVKTEPGLCGCGVPEGPICPGTLGACCDPDPFGSCTETVQAGCNCGNCVWSPSLSCGQAQCVHTSIPTVSEWGVLVLALSLLILAKLGFGRRAEEAV